MLNIHTDSKTQPPSHRTTRSITYQYSLLSLVAHVTLLYLLGSTNTQYYRAAPFLDSFTHHKQTNNITPKYWAYIVNPSIHKSQSISCRNNLLYQLTNNIKTPYDLPQNLKVQCHLFLEMSHIKKVYCHRVNLKQFNSHYTHQNLSLEQLPGAQKPFINKLINKYIVKKWSGLNLNIPHKCAYHHIWVNVAVQL